MSGEEEAVFGAAVMVARDDLITVKDYCDGVWKEEKKLLVLFVFAGLRLVTRMSMSVRHTITNERIPFQEK